MADGTSVGMISLDLVIKEKIGEQLEKIKTAFQGAISKPAEQATKATEQAMKGIDKAVQKSADSMAQCGKNAAGEYRDDIKKAMADCVEEFGKQQEHIAENIQSMKPVNIEINPDYEPSKVEAEVEKITQGIQDKSSKAVEKAFEDFKVPTTPIERLNKQLDNAAEKMGILQDKHKELEAQLETSKSNEEAKKIIAGMNTVESQIIGQQDKIDKLNGSVEKLNNPIKKVAQTADKTSKQINSASSQASKAFEKSNEKIKASAQKTHGFVSKLLRSIKTAARRVFVMAGILAFLKAIRSAISTAATGNEEFAKSLNDVKANLSVAFTPIVQTIMPYLNSLMSGLASVTKAVASFISGLFGTTYKKSLAATKAVKKTASEAKKAQSTYLASFDVANVAPSQEKTADTAQSATDNAVDYSKLDKDGNKWAEKLGSKIRKYLGSAFSAVKEKAKSVFSYLGEWSSKNFAPTFKNIWADLKQRGADLKQILSGMFADLSTLGAPLKQYFEGDFTQCLKDAFTTAGDILNGAFDTFNTVFSDIWNVAVFPILQNLITIGLPMLTQYSDECIKTFGTLFKSVKSVFDTLWAGVVKPILKLISKVWCDTVNVLSDAWKKWGKPIFDGIRKAIENTRDIILKAWNSFVKPVFDKVMDVLNELWSKHIKPFVREVLDCIGTLIEGILKVYNKTLAPLIKWIVEKFGPPIAKVINTIIDKLSVVWSGVVDTVKGIVKTLKGIIKFVTSVFTGDWKGAWNGIKTIFKGVWDSLVAIVKVPINLIISMINGLTGVISKAINYIIDGINKISIKIPDWSWLPDKIQGKSLGFNIGHMTVPEIPKLATGGLATAPTLAMVGDNKNARSDPEVISPLSKLQGIIGNDSETAQLLRQILVWLKSMNTEFKGTVDSKVLFDCMINENRKYKRQNGVSAF